MKRHNRTYTVLLIALALFYGLCIIDIAFTNRSPTPLERSRWVLMAWINAALVAAMVMTLFLRGVAPRTGRIATKALNIVLLTAIPFGTVLGIYGLMKVDKETDAAGA